MSVCRPEITAVTSPSPLIHTHRQKQKHTKYAFSLSLTSLQLNHPSGVTVNASQPTIQQCSISIESLILALLLLCRDGNGFNSW